MSESLQDFKDSSYHRPDQPWLEVPIASAALDSSEQIAIRQHALRSRRQIFTLALTTFTIGGLLIVFNSPFRNNYLVPGPLVSSHAQILTGQGADRCSACHDAANQSFSQWVTGMFAGVKENFKCQSDLCMECHKNSISGEFALRPHNVDPGELAERTNRFLTQSFKPAGVRLTPPINAQKQLACSACHREHHGDSDLSNLTDQQCQTCHAGNYCSFETDHPEFSSWPVNRRARIAFDHASHATKHFPGKSTLFDCSSCHVDDGFKNVKLLAPYESTCAHCHNEQILDSGEAGLALFVLPMLDLDAIRAADCDVGNWPTSATGDFDGPLPPVMRLMLGVNEHAKKALDYFGPEFDFSNVDRDDAHQVRLACDLVWSIKYLLYDLSVEGPETIRKRLEIALGRSVAVQEITNLAADLNQPVFQDAVRRWLPGLNVEVAKHRWGSTAMKIGWMPGEILARYEAQPDELLAPNPLNGLIKPLDATSGLPHNPDSMGLRRPTPTQTQPNHAPHYSANPSPPVRLPETSIKPWQRELADPGELLAENPIRGRMGMNSSKNEAVNLVDPTDDPSGQVGNDPNVDAPRNNELAIPNSVLKILRGTVPEIAKGGWFRDDQFFKVTYRPGGHADKCIQAWTELITGIPDADVRPDTSSLFAKLTSSNGTGMCRSCHTVDRLADDSFKVNWEPVYRDVSIRSFTRFSHGPHVIQPMLQDCSHCHELDSERSNSNSFVGFNASVAISNFKPIQKANCTTCHQKGQTDNSCTQCHNYHVGSHVIGTNHD